MFFLEKLKKYVISLKKYFFIEERVKYLIKNPPLTGFISTFA